MKKQNNGRKFFATAATAALVASAIVPVASAAEFKDASSISSWAKEAVQYLTDKGFIQGDEKGNFNPAGTLTRAEAAEILSKALDLQPKGTEDYSDVDAKDWFYNAVLATSPELFNGMGNGKFEPKAQLTREQAAKVIVEGYQLTGKADLSKFADASKASKWAVSYLETAVENRVINGKGSLLAPQDKISREEFATMVKRTIDATDKKEEVTLAVASVKGFNAKTIEVKFNTAADVTAADFSVKKGSVNVNVSNVVIAEDKKSAKIELASKLTEGEYTVFVKAGENTLTGSLVAENEKLAKIEILSDVTPLVINGDKHSVNVGIQALNQYGEDITKSASLTATATGAVVETANATITNNEVTVELKNTVKKDDSFVLTVIDPSTGQVASKTIKVSDVAIASTVEVGQLYNKDGKTLSQDSATATDKFYLPVTVKDQYGKEVKLNTTVGNLVVAGVNTSIATVGTTFETISINGKDTQVLPVTITNTALAGTTPVTFVVAATGSNAQASVTVAPGKSIANITLGAPTNEVVAQGETINFPLTVVDNQGNEIKTLKELKALKDGRGFDAATEAKISEKDGVLVYSSTNAPANSLTVVVQSENGKVAAKTVSVREAATVATIGSIDAKASTPLTTNFRSDDAAPKEFTTASFVFQDQYGRTIASNSPLLSGVTVKATVADATKSPFDLTPAGKIAIKANLTGITAKSDTVTFTAFNATGAEIKGSGLDAKFIIADVSELIPGSFTVEPVEKVYVEGGVIKGGEYSTDAPVVKGKAKSGEIVTLKAGEYSVSATPTLNADFFKDAEGKVIKEKTVDRIVTINQTGEEIKVPVTYSTAAPEIEVVKAYDKTVATKEVTAINVSAKTEFNLTALLNTATFKGIDQYGVVTEFDANEAEKVTFSTSGKATFTGNGTKDAKVVTADENAVVKATITTTNGKTIAIAVTFTEGVVVAAPPTFTSSINVATANDLDTLGVIGTIATSDHEGVATVTIDNGKIKIVSVTAGSATITVTDGVSASAATIPVTVAADGTITLGSITKAQ